MLGLSVTPTTVRLVVVEGADADGVTLGKDAFHVRPGVDAHSSDHVAAAVLRTQAIATRGAHRLQSIGVTWSDNADADATLLLGSLREVGFDNVAAVRWPEAAESLTRVIWRIGGRERTAICVVEPDAVTVSVIDRDGATFTDFSPVGGDRLAGWLAAFFRQHGYRPDQVYLVGSSRSLEAIAPMLERALSVPVVIPPETELALARGAAVASTQDLAFAALSHSPGDSGSSILRRSYLGPVALLSAGVLAFVVSVSTAIALQLTPDKKSPTAEERQVSGMSGASAVAEAAPPAVQGLPSVVAPPPTASPPIVGAPAAEPEPPAAVSTPAPVYGPMQPAPEAPAHVPPATAPAPAGVPPAAAPAPEQLPPAVPPGNPAYVPPGMTPPEQPRLRDRLLEKIPLVNRVHTSPGELSQVPAEQAPDQPAPPPPAPSPEMPPP